MTSCMGVWLEGKLWSPWLQGFVRAPQHVINTFSMKCEDLPSRKQDFFLFMVMSSLATRRSKLYHPHSTTCLPYKDISGLNLIQCMTSCMGMLRASCLTLEINQFRCYEAKIEESENVGKSPGVEPRTLLA